jgi:Trypsin-like peptidase domain
MTRLPALLASSALAAVVTPAAAQSSRPAPSEARALVVRLVSPPQIGAGIIVGADDARVYIVTAKHVVRMGRREGVFVSFEGSPKDSVKATLADTAAEGVDIAVVTVARAALQRLPDFDRRGDPKILSFNHPVSPMGCPRGMCWAVPAPADRLVGIDRQGIIFQSVFVNPGSSGGALFNEYWEVVGMVTGDQPPRANALDIDQVLDQVHAFGHPVSLRRPNVPREGFPLHVGALVMTSTTKDEAASEQESRLPSGRLVLTRRGQTYGLTWHLSGLRLAPPNLAVHGGMGGVDVDFQWGRFLVQPFFEIGLASVEGRYDAGGYHLAGGDYVPLWRKAKQDVLGFGGGMSVLVGLLSHATLEMLVAHWSFTLPESLPTELGLPNLFIGAGFRWGL